jgi:ribose-phosphate pyrophosphokinase
VRAVFVTDTVSVTEKDWPQLHVVSIAPLIGSSLKRFLADGSNGNL